MATYKSGGDIDTHCNRCELDLAHVIIAMVGDRPARVMCKTCKNEHVYRGPKTGTRSSGSRTSTPGAKKAPAMPQYDRVMEGKDISRAERYKVSTTFSEGSVLDHRDFGLGLVMRVLSDQKIEVLFKAGLKLLAHAR